MRAREVTGAVGHERSFTITRDGRRIGELVSLRSRRRFVPSEESIAVSRNAPTLNLSVFRADQNTALDQQARDSYGH
jgi:hypothetical protein